MKKLIALLVTLLLVVSSCSAGRYVSINNSEREFSAVEVLYNQHPELVPYYEAGVLKITSLREIRSEVGYTYDIRYKFVRKYLYDQERYQCLKEYYPELYDLYINGVINIRSVYRYVDDNLAIRHNVTYSRLYDYYYENVPLKEDIQEYFKREVLPYNKDAWIDKKKTKVGYEIPFTRYFYKYVAPESSDSILKRIKENESNIMDSLKRLLEEDI